MAVTTLLETLPIAMPVEELAAWCIRWQVREVAVFGSALRNDFGPDSDVDVLITLAPGVRYGFAFFDLIDELAAIVGRPVDVVTRGQLERGAQDRRSQEILHTARIIYSV